MASFYMTEEQHKALEALCERYGVERLELFGSATTDAFAYGHSDLDFLVEFISTVDLGPWMATYFDLKDALEKLFGRPVDLVFPSALKNPYFIRSVNETRRTVYERQIAETARKRRRRLKRDDRMRNDDLDAGVHSWHTPSSRAVQPGQTPNMCSVK